MAKSYGMVGGQSGNPPDSYTITPTTTNQTIPKDTRLEQDLTVKGDVDLVESNIRTGVTLFNKVGTFNSFDASEQNSVAFLASDNYSTEYTINSFTDLNITETASSGITPSEEYSILSGVSNTGWYFGAKYMYKLEPVVGSSGEYESWQVECYDKTSKTLISTINLAEYLSYHGSSVAIHVASYQNIDSFCMLSVYTDGSAPNYFIVIQGASLVLTNNLGTTTFAQQASINSSINGAFVIGTYIAVKSSDEFHMVAYDTLNKAVLYHKTLTPSSSVVQGIDFISILKPSNIQYDSITNNIDNFSYFYAIDIERTSMNISKFNISNGSLISTISSIPLFASGSGSEIPNVAGVTVDNLNNSEQFCIAYGLSSTSATHIFRHALSSTASTIWQKSITTTGSQNNRDGNGFFWDRYVNTIYLSSNLATYKFKAIDGEQMFACDLYAADIDRYTHTCYSGYPTNKRCFDTSVSATRTIETDTFTATIEEV